MSEKWFYYKQEDAVTKEQLQEMIKTRTLDPDTLVWSQSLTEWKPARCVDTLEIEENDTPPPLLPTKTVLDTECLDKSFAQKWPWVLGVIFAAIISLGFYELAETLFAGRKHSLQLGAHIFVAGCFFAFILYDVSAQYALVSRFPYKLSVLSTIRYALDMAMSFLLLVILRWGVSPNPEDAVFHILVCVTLWHIGALAWHWDAKWDCKKEVPSLCSYLPHFVYIVIYWISIYGIAFDYEYFKKDNADINSTPYLFILSVEMAVVSLIRSKQISSNLAKW